MCLATLHMSQNHNIACGHPLNTLKNPLCSTFSIHVQEVIYTQIHHTSVQTSVLHLLRLCVTLSLPPHYTCSRKNGIPRDLITCRCILLKQPWCSYYYPTWASELQPLRSCLWMHMPTPLQALINSQIGWGPEQNCICQESCILVTFDGKTL